MVNITNLSNTESVYDLITYSNSVTGGMLAMLFIFALFFILLINQLNKYTYNNIFESAAASGFVCFLISILFRLINLGDYWTIIVFAVITFISVIILWIKD
jgi:hypothetical protein